jgi:hypothetical protein
MAAATPQLASLDPAQAPKTSELDAIRERVFDHLRSQGFKLADGGLLMPVADGKDALRSLQENAVAAQRLRAAPALSRFDKRFVLRLAAGNEIDPSAIRPALRLLPLGRSEDAALWRWCSLHWSVPVSSGYGRRLKFLVVDEAHGNAVMGLIGLSDPVFALGVRDAQVGWSREVRSKRLTSVMDAFVLGAVPPYSRLLGGKLMASLLQSDQVRDAFRQRYGHATTLISGVDPDAQLAFVSTSSALGRSSVYNRVKREDGTLAMRSIGYTKGSGDFHFSGAIYEELAALAAEHAGEGVSHRHENWGSGFRNRREVVQRALRALGLNPNRMRVHGVLREVFVSELATNSFAWLRGDDDGLDWKTLDETGIGAWWRNRWAEPRSRTTEDWKAFEVDDWRLYRE